MSAINTFTIILARRLNLRSEMGQKIYEIAIIGAGAAGVMAALRGVLNNDEVLLFTGTAKDKKRSREKWVYKVDNMPGFHGYKKAIEEPNRSTIEWIEQSEFKDKLLVKKNVGIKNIVKSENCFKLISSTDEEFFASYVVLCTGIMDVQPHLNDSIKAILPFANTQVVDYCLRCDGHHTLNKHTSVIGNDSSAAWVAVMLKERYNNPSMCVLTNGQVPNFSDDVKDLLKLYHIEVFEQKIIEVLGDSKKGILEGYKFDSGKTLKSEFSFVSLGVIVYNELAKVVGANIDPRGYVLADSKGMTNIENFYVAGDIRAGLKKQIYTAWDMAVDTMDEVNRKIRLNKRLLKIEESKNV